MLKEQRRREGEEREGEERRGEGKKKGKRKQGGEECTYMYIQIVKFFSFSSGHTHF